MCGLVSIFNYLKTKPVNSDELIAIRDTMISRGPDGAGFWLSENQKVGMAQRRLKIIDLSDAAKQPMATGDKKVRIVFNGEIYNYQALRKTLIAKGYRFFSYSDTEVLLYLYREKGREMVHDLRGMFAFVIWDEVKQGMLLARDHFGIKPLYYNNDGETIRIASQVKALLNGSIKKKSLEPAGHVGFYLWGHVPEPYTLYKEIRALPAGSTLWIDHKGAGKPSYYFKVSEIIRTTLEAHVDISENKEKLRESLLESVRLHLHADVPVGVFLSAGLDSTTLIGLASEIKKDNSLNTFTLGFEEYKNTFKDETHLAQQVASYYKTAHITHWVNKRDFQEEAEAMLTAMDQPTIDGPNTYFVSKMAASLGLKVALSGLGGDELFGGYVNFYQIPQLVSWLKYFKYFTFFNKGFRYFTGPIIKHFISPKYAGLFELSTNFAGAYLLRRGLFMPWELPNLLDPDLVRLGWEDLQPFLTLNQKVDNINDPYFKITCLELECYMRNQLLRDSDWASMAHSLELRVPLVDIDLFKTVLQLSHFQKLKKQDVAKTLTNPLPRSVLIRKKTGFNLPVDQWIMAKQTSKPNLHGLRSWAKYIYSRFN